MLIISLAFLFTAFLPLLKNNNESIKTTTKSVIKVQDFTGQEVVLQKPAERIVCLLESGLAGLYMLGAAEKVIGVNHYPYQPHIYPYYEALDQRFAQRTLTDVGEGTTVDLEKIAALNPDLIIIWAGYPDLIKTLKARGFTVFAVQLDNFTDIWREIELLSQLTGQEERGKQLIKESQEQLTLIQNKLESVSKEKQPTCYFVWAESKLDAAGGNSTGTELIRLAGGHSVTENVRQEHIKANLEQLVKWNPEVIISWYGPNVTPEKFYTDNQWKNITAVKNNRVYQLPDAFSCDLWTLKYIYGVKCAAKYLHPDLFPEDLEQEKAKLFRLLYGEKGEKLAHVQI